MRAGLFTLCDPHDEAQESERACSAIPFPLHFDQFFSEVCATDKDAKKQMQQSLGWNGIPHVCDFDEFGRFRWH